MSPCHPYHLYVDPEEGRRTLTLILPGHAPVVVNGDHPNFDRLIEEAELGDLSPDEMAELADASKAVERTFDTLSERVKVAAGRVYFDGDELDNALTKHILRCIADPSTGDFHPLVRFLERLYQNPSAHSREQLFEWLDRRDFTVAADGCIIGYKGVAKSGDLYVSINHGPAIVNGREVNGAVPNEPGSVVEIARSKVTFDPAVACASGLHVGDYEYASGWARGALLRVLVDPRDVVSVPTDSNAAKMRVCRYKVLDVIEAPETEPISYDTAWEDAYEDGIYDEEYCEVCGEFHGGLS